jgi:thioredoxin reductase/NAD-dependent dihydropyrimidine dehydrogenase PreA subunit
LVINGFFKTMEIIIEEILIYGFVAILIVAVIFIYIRKQKRESKVVEHKINQAQEDGLYEPVSLYPVVDPNRCIKSGACITACPEHDILGIRNGKATIINASQCIGHGACFRACPVEAISLWIGTEKRGVDLPEVMPNFETNVKGIFIAGELGGMGLIRNAVSQGQEAIENIAKTIYKERKAEYDVIIVGAGPAGISAALAAKKAGLKALTLEQDSIGGSVFTYPRSKVIMTHPMELPLYGKIKLKETSKDELFRIWNTVLDKHKITIKEKTKVESVNPSNVGFEVKTLQGEVFTTQTVLLALGRRGTPRKLNVKGEMRQKVAYRLLDAELIKNKNILVVGGGDSAVEAALLLSNENKVTLSYRAEKFSRLKPRNTELINNAILTEKLDMKFNSNLKSIEEDFVIINENNSVEDTQLENDFVYIFAGGELPSQFLRKCGINVSTKHGEVVMKH